MGKSRVRINRKGVPNYKHGQSSSSNASVTKFRDEAKAQRIANRAPLLAVDERMEDVVGDDVTHQLGGLVSNIL